MAKSTILEVHWNQDFSELSLFDPCRNDTIFEGTITEFADWALIEKYGKVRQIHNGVVIESKIPNDGEGGYYAKDGERCKHCGALMERSEEGYCNSCGHNYDTGKIPDKGLYNENKCPGCGTEFKIGEPYPDVKNCEVCERYGKPLKEMLEKIANQTVTCEDFDNYITLQFSESAPESIRDRVRRRTLTLNTRDHLDNDEHQKLELPAFSDRVDPKRKSSGHSQMHGRGKIGHDHSTRTQRRNAATEAIEFIRANIGKDITEENLNGLNRNMLLNIANRYSGEVNKDWFDSLIKMLRGNNV